MTDARFAPSKLARAIALRDHLYALVDAGELTRQEANLAVAAAMTLGTPPSKLKCPSCGSIHRLVGVGDVFSCPCSPDEQRSVWDCAIG